MIKPMTLCVHCGNPLTTTPVITGTGKYMGYTENECGCLRTHYTATVTDIEPLNPAKPELIDWLGQTNNVGAIIDKLNEIITWINKQ